MAQIPLFPMLGRGRRISSNMGGVVTMERDSPKGKTAAIVQSNYIPWKGYFDLIRSVDEFIILDDVQYTRRDWRNRNKIKTPTGTVWLTIPVESKGNFTQAIKNTEVCDPTWNKTHLKT